MRVVKAEHAGVCYGVQRALDMVDELANKPGDVFTMGPLIHNPQVVSELAARGVVPVDDHESVDHGVVVLRTHGVEPSVVESLEARGIAYVDATCPHVSRAQNAAARLANEGMTVLVIGRADHPEVRGICAHAAAKALVIADSSEIPEEIVAPVGIVVQTTESRAKLDQVVEALRARGIEPTVKNTICAATRHRQQAAAELAQRVDAIVVIGGRNSSNTTHLYEICAANCEKAYHVESADELERAWFDGVEVVGVTAGASTPDDQIESVISALEAW